MKLLLTLSLFSFFLFSCEEATDVDPAPKEEETAALTPPTDDSNVVASGSFKGASGHTTTGTAQVKQIDSSTKSLVLTNFKTDRGPDLRFYLAEDKNASNFIELTEKVSNGNKTILIPNSTDLDKQKFLLIWCKAFSVSFGYVELEKPE